jgi:CBS domain-containing protein
VVVSGERSTGNVDVGRAEDRRAGGNVLPPTVLIAAYVEPRGSREGENGGSALVRVVDAMTRDAITVSPEMPLKEAAELLARHQVSGLPVVDEAKVVGVVSEADIVARSTGSRESRSLIREFLSGRKHQPDLGATRAGDAMTSPAITIAPQRPVAEAARVMVERKVNRLPVVDDSGLVGIVTRADLVRAYVRPDEELEREIREDVAGRALAIDPNELEITVERGAVKLAGEVERPVDAELLERFTEAVPGVVSVQSELRPRLGEATLPSGDPRVPPRQRDRGR